MDKIFFKIMLVIMNLLFWGDLILDPDFSTFMYAFGFFVCYSKSYGLPNPKILKIHGFVWRHLLVENFWWMFYAAIKSHVTGKSYMIGSWELMSFIEIGATEPDKAVWDAGLAVSTPGHIFGKRILQYRKNRDEALFTSS